MACVLLIDDEPAVRFSGAQMLRFLGHQVITASDGLEGLQFLSLGSCNLVIADLQMPGLAGAELAAAIHRLNPTIPVIGSWAEGSIPPFDPGVLARKLGVQGTLPKPYGVDELKAAIDAALKGGVAGSPPDGPQ